MKAKIGAIFLVSVMAFAALGAAYAHWEETLTITGVMETDDIDPYFHCIESNDVDNWDPNECGYWDLVDGWQGVRRDKDVGSCTVQMGATTNEMEIDITDAYPCYYAHPKFCISNAGSCPVLIHGLMLTKLSFEWTDPETGEVVDKDWDVNIPLADADLNTWSYVDIIKGADGWKVKVKQDVGKPEDYDFALKLTGDLIVDTQLDPIDWDGYEEDYMENPLDYTDILYGDLCIHFENGCRQEATYDFTIGIVFYNWPHYVGNPPWVPGTP